MNEYCDLLRLDRKMLRPAKQDECRPAPAHGAASEGAGRPFLGKWGPPPHPRPPVHIRHTGTPAPWPSALSSFTHAGIPPVRSGHRSARRDPGSVSRLIALVPGLAEFERRL